MEEASAARTDFVSGRGGILAQDLVIVVADLHADVTSERTHVRSVILRMNIGDSSSCTSLSICMRKPTDASISAVLVDVRDHLQAR